MSLDHVEHFITLTATSMFATSMFCFRGYYVEFVEYAFTMSLWLSIVDGVR